LGKKSSDARNPIWNWTIEGHNERGGKTLPKRTGQHMYVRKDKDYANNLHRASGEDEYSKGQVTKGKELISFV